MVSAALLLAALVLSPIIGGGFGALTNGILQLLVFAALVAPLISRPAKSPATAQTLSTEARGYLVVAALGFAAALALTFVSRSPAAVLLGPAWWITAAFIPLVWTGLQTLPGRVALAVFLTAVMVSVLASESIFASARQLLFYLACFGAYAGCARLCRDRRVAAAMVWGLLLAALGICLFGIRHYALSTGGGADFWKTITGTPEPMRLFGPFINPGFFAGFLVISLPVTLGVYFVTRRTAPTVLAGVAFVLQTIALMLTGTKFGIISAVASLVVLFGLAAATGALRRTRFQRLIAIAVVLVPLLVVFSAPVRSRISAAEAGGSQVHSTQFRVATWRATVDMIKANPIIGVGPGAYDIAYPRYATAGPTKYAHQSYLQIASESGVVALAAFVVLLLAIGLRSLRAIARGVSDEPGRAAKDDSRASGITWSDLVPYSGWRMMNCAVFAALLGSAVRNLVDSDWYVMGIALPFWALAGLLVAQTNPGEVVETGVARRWRFLLIAAAVMAIAFSVIFGLGDYLAPDKLSADLSASQALAGYRTASAVSPLDPGLRRELGKFLAGTGAPQSEALPPLRTAIELEPTNSANYSALGVVMAHYGEWKASVPYLRHALRFSPNSTQTTFSLAMAYDAMGAVAPYENTLRRLLAIEDTDYEQLKGAPELVDTTFAFAHSHFGHKYLGQREYSLAAAEFLAVTGRLERWRAKKDVLEMARATGMLTPEEEQVLLDLLRDGYTGLADAYEGLGNTVGARDARRKSESI